MRIRINPDGFKKLLEVLTQVSDAISTTTRKIGPVDWLTTTNNWLAAGKSPGSLFRNPDLTVSIPVLRSTS